MDVDGKKLIVVSTNSETPRQIALKLKAVGTKNIHTIVVGTDGYTPSGTIWTKALISVLDSM